MQLALICAFFTLLYIFPSHRCSEDDNSYTNTWAVEVKDGEQSARLLAEQYGMRLVGPVGSLENFFLFENKRLQKRSPTEHVSFTDAVQHDPRVAWAEQQRVLKRVKRDLLDQRDLSRVRPAFNASNPQRPLQRVSEQPALAVRNFNFNDAYYDQQWYLHGYLGAQSANVADMKIQQTWNRSYIGRGVVLTILDDGVEHTHTDLIGTYDAKASYDLNGRDRDPFPRYDITNENRHGTRCAGVVAAKANNSVCVVGIAYGARVGGIRMLDGEITDAVEASALSHAPDHVDIYSASWGPDDSGNVVDGPGPMALKAFQQGIERGRRGLGSIYVWASGNGGGSDDSCAFDGYANSIYTLSVSSVSQWNVRPWYLEECASTLVSTYSSGEPREAQVATTDIHNRCTLQHTGTSASAPIAASIIALVLEANANLTWRDVQYISILAANNTPFKDANWVLNGVKRKVSLRYGYGLMNAYSMVRLAEAWSSVPSQRNCRVYPDSAQRRRSLSNTPEVMVNVSGERCSIHPQRNAQGARNNTIRYLEHVQAVITLRYYKRGDLQISLISPSGTRSVLMPKRRYDHRSDGLNNWVLTSVHFWGETPYGTWRLVLENVGSVRHYTGDLMDWYLIFYGVYTRPLRIRRSTMEEIGAFPPLTSSVTPTAGTTSTTRPRTTVSTATTTTTAATTSTVRTSAISNASMPSDRRRTQLPFLTSRMGASGLRSTTRSRSRNKPRDETSVKDDEKNRDAVSTDAADPMPVHFKPYISPEIDARLVAMHAVFVDYDGSCHPECASNCDGPTDYDCRACRHDRVLDRSGLYRCVPFSQDVLSIMDSESEPEEQLFNGVSLPSFSLVFVLLASFTATAFAYR